MSDYQTRNICKPGLDLSTSQCGKTSGDLQESYVAQVLDISGAPINIFKLLGVHEQGTTIDLAKNGIALASSSQPGFEVNNAEMPLLQALSRYVAHAPTACPQSSSMAQSCYTPQYLQA